MKFLVDAHLPRRLARWLQQQGHDTIHTLNLPEGNRSGDDKINDVSLAEQRIVITKDEDFVTSFTIQHKPHKLLLISTGNIKNNDLLAIFEANLSSIIAALDDYSFVELDRNNLTIHE